MCLSKASVRNTVSKCLFSRALAGLRWVSGTSNGNELTLNMSNKAAVSAWPAKNSFCELNDFLSECWRLLYCLRRAQRSTTDAQTLLCVCVCVCVCVCFVQVGNLGLLFVLLFFIYAALGVELFGDLGEIKQFPFSVLKLHFFNLFFILFYFILYIIYFFKHFLYILFICIFYCIICFKYYIIMNLLIIYIYI